jgi:hypothetical protein
MEALSKLKKQAEAQETLSVRLLKRFGLNKMLGSVGSNIGGADSSGSNIPPSPGDEGATPGRRRSITRDRQSSHSSLTAESQQGPTAAGAVPSGGPSSPSPSRGAASGWPTSGRLWGGAAAADSASPAAKDESSASAGSGAMSRQGVR